MDGSPGRDEAVIFDAARGVWLCFSRPRAVLTAGRPEEVAPLLAAVDAAAARGQWAAGFVTYEAASGFDRALLTPPPLPGLPLAWFGLYDAPRACGRLAPPADDARPPAPWQPGVLRADYDAAIGRIRAQIAAGDTYQVNYTLRLRAERTAPPWVLFRQLALRQPTACGAYVDAGRWVVGSVSPELFFDWRGDQLVTLPMKGTQPRGRWPAEDERQRAALRRSLKDRAENVMIVDMARNDLGRIATAGSVRVERRFAVEPYPTVWQMTSLVACRTRVTGVRPIFEAAFPAASITGAPKCAAMRIIAALEPSPRGVYTGAVGFVGPGRQARFNVAIRTVVWDRDSGQAEYGVGGGIVWDSNAASEYAECEAKARVLTRPAPTFALLETLRWTLADGFWLLERHLDRLAASTARLGRRVERAAWAAQLTAAAADWDDVPRRVRLVVAAGGMVEIEAAPLTPLPRPYRLRLACEPVESADWRLFHKTTDRGLYEAARRAQPEADDVLLWNRQGEVTESCIANLLYEREGVWYTPPLACGLLPGVCRAQLLATGAVRERVLPVAELARAPRLRLANAVRGVWDVRLTAP